MSDFFDYDKVASFCISDALTNTAQNATNISLQNAISIKRNNDGVAVVATFAFCKDSKAFLQKDAPTCALSLFGAGSMRFRWNEQNPKRNDFFDALGIEPKRIAPIELIHSKNFFYRAQNDELATKHLQGDGILTSDKALVPTVTVADCVPIYLYNPQKNLHGMLHSGWRGTGIIISALQDAQKRYDTKPSEWLVVIGPHIQSCCYNVEKDREDYFAKNFTSTCVKNGMLSLARANVYLLLQYGVKPTNIALAKDCTCCTKPIIFGSHRRETKNLQNNISLEERSHHFTVMASFIGYF